MRLRKKKKHVKGCVDPLAAFDPTGLEGDGPTEERLRLIAELRRLTLQRPPPLRPTEVISVAPETVLFTQLRVQWTFEDGESYGYYIWDAIEEGVCPGGPSRLVELLDGAGQPLCRFSLDNRRLFAGRWARERARSTGDVVPAFPAIVVATVFADDLLPLLPGWVAEEHHVEDWGLFARRLGQDPERGWPRGQGHGVRGLLLGAVAARAEQRAALGIANVYGR